MKRALLDGLRGLLMWVLHALIGWLVFAALYAAWQLTN